MIAQVGAESAGLLARLHAESFDRPWSEADFAALLATPSVIALAEGEDAFVLVQRVLDEAEVLTLAVGPTARRAGLGRALVEAAAALLAGLGVADLRLEVAEDNAPALALYRAAAFVAVGRRPRYYARGAGGAPVDAILMLRRLNRAPV